MAGATIFPILEMLFHSAGIECTGPADNVIDLLQPFPDDPAPPTFL